MTELGRKLTQAIGEDCAFSQQYDAVTMEPNGYERDYGPTTLAFLEYTSRMYGVNLTPDEIFWGAVESQHTWQYSQIWGDDVYTIKKSGDRVEASTRDRTLFTFSPGFRIVTDRSGKPKSAVRIEQTPGFLFFNGLGLGKVEPNQKVMLNDENTEHI